MIKQKTILGEREVDRMIWHRFLQTKLGQQIMFFTIGNLFVVKKALNRERFQKIWYSIWLEQGYYEDDPKEPLNDFAQYNPYATDFILFYRSKACGTLRIIHNNKQEGLPTLKEFCITTQLWHTENIKEITLFTVDKRFRGSNLFYLPLFVLIKHIARWGKRRGIEGWVMMADERLFYLLRRKKIPIHQIGPQRFYKGSTTYPAYISTQEFLYIMRKHNPFLAL